MCFRALCTILETESLEIGTVAAGSVSFDKAELISEFSVGVKIVICNHIKQFPSNILYSINIYIIHLHIILYF